VLAETNGERQVIEARCGWVLAPCRGKGEAKMAEAKSDDTPRMQRRWLYTNVPNVFHRLDDDLPLFHVNMDTWYFQEFGHPLPYALPGRMDIGTGPITKAQGAPAFIARQVATFLDAFSGIFRPASVQVGYTPRLTGIQGSWFDFPAPQTPEEVQALQTGVEQATYDGIISLYIRFEMQATVRDEYGQFVQLWLPDAGSATYHAHHRDTSTPNPVRHTTLLTPLAKTGIAPWSVNLRCAFLSLFRETNAEVLAQVRDRWQRWLQNHPISAQLGDAEHDVVEDDSSDDQEEDYIVTLAVPPPGSPLDNRDLSERNLPGFRTGWHVGRKSSAHHLNGWLPYNLSLPRLPSGSC
jgi:hypothetical protein